MTKIIYTSKMQKILVDDEDFDYLNKFFWNSYKNSYVRGLYKGKMVSLHRLIMGFPDGMVVDHKNHDLFDNRKENLRICTWSQNNTFKRKIKEATSKYKGVHLAPTGRWRSVIRHNKIKIQIGMFDKEIDAAKEYNKKAIELLGEFAYINDIQE